MGLVGEMSKVARHRDLIKELVIRDLKLRYERSVLGFLWSLLNPLLMIGIYTFVFSVVLRVGIERFPLFLVPVLLPWNFLVRCLANVSPLVYQSGYLINRARFPSESLIFGGVLSAFVDFCLEMLIFAVILAAVGSPLLPGVLAVPLVMVFHLLFVTGVVMFFAVGYVFYRDTQYVVPLISTAWFFMTPVFYAVSSVPEKYLRFYLLNPMVHLAACFREPLYTGHLPSWTMLATAGIIAGGFFAAGWVFFNRYKRSFAEVI